MRNFLQTFERGKTRCTFLWRSRFGDNINNRDVRRRCYYHFAWKHHLLTAPYQHFSSFKLHVLKKSDSISPFRFSASFSIRSGSSKRPDPFARRPTSKCDPYGQDGKPLTLDEALVLMRTVEPEWRIMMRKDDSGEKQDLDTSFENISDGCDDGTFVPFAISKVFWHEEYMIGAKFSTHVAAVAQVNAQHFPHEVILSRKLHSRSKSWKICTQIICRTHVLQGLSHHDFYLATLIDIEAQRPEIRGMLTDQK